MNVYDFIDRKIGELQERIEASAQRIVFWTKIANSTATGENDAVEGWPTEGAEPKGQQQARRTSSWGVAGRPPSGVLAAVARALAGTTAGVIVGIATGKYGRQDLKTGETQLFNKVTGCEVFLDENGKLRLNSAAGQDAVVNDGTKRGAAADDEVDIFSIAVTAGAGGAITAITLTPIGGGTPITLNAASPGPVTLTRYGKINPTSTRRFKV